MRTGDGTYGLRTEKRDTDGVDTNLVQYPNGLLS